MPYDPDYPIKPELWDGNFHSISLHGLLEYLPSDLKNIKKSLNYLAKYIKNKRINTIRINGVDNPYNSYNNIIEINSML